MTARIAEASPLLKARLAGGFWLIVIVAGGFAFFTGSALIVRGDAAGTATNIMASERLYRLGFAANLMAGACYAGVTVLLYDLLKPVSRSLSLLAASFGLLGIAIGGATSFIRLAPLVLLGGAEYLGAFTTAQLQALALTSLRLDAQGSNIGLVFFGCQCLVIGYLIVRSRFLPRVLGVLLAVGGASYIVNSFASFLSPGSAAYLAPYILPAAIVGEGSLCLWLIVMGVNVQRWTEHTARAA